MNYRTVVMYLEVACFVSCLSGWFLVCSTLPTGEWEFSELGSTVQTTGIYYSNLWMDCIADSTGVTDCKYYPSMLGLSSRSAVTRRLSGIVLICPGLSHFVRDCPGLSQVQICVQQIQKPQKTTKC